MGLESGLAAVGRKITKKQAFVAVLCGRLAHAFDNLPPHGQRRNLIVSDPKAHSIKGSDLSGNQLVIRLQVGSRPPGSWLVGLHR